MDVYDRFEFMVRIHGRCGGSSITVERMSEEEQEQYRYVITNKV